MGLINPTGPMRILNWEVGIWKLKIKRKEPRCSATPQLLKLKPTIEVSKNGQIIDQNEILERLPFNYRRRRTFYDTRSQQRSAKTVVNVISCLPGQGKGRCGKWNRPKTYEHPSLWAILCLCVQGDGKTALTVSSWQRMRSRRTGLGSWSTTGSKLHLEDATIVICSLLKLHIVSTWRWLNPIWISINILTLDFLWL